MRRVSVTRGGTTLVFVSQGNDLLAEYTSGTAAGSPQRNYVYGSRIDEPLAMIDASDTHYYHADASTSIRAITDSSGNVEELYRYAAYGAPTILAPNGSTVRTSSAVNNRFLFTAREFDDATTSTATQQTGWYHFRNRPYSATLGRFPSRDPLEYVDGASLYRGYFVPNHIDPSGRERHIPCADGSVHTVADNTPPEFWCAGRGGPAPVDPNNLPPEIEPWIDPDPEPSPPPPPQPPGMPYNPVDCMDWAYKMDDKHPRGGETYNGGYRHCLGACCVTRSILPPFVPFYVIGCWDFYAEGLGFLPWAKGDSKSDIGAERVGVGVAYSGLSCVDGCLLEFP